MTLGKTVFKITWSVALMVALPATVRGGGDGSQGMVGHWMLEADCRDSSGNGNHGVGRAVTFVAGSKGSAGGAALFDGRASMIEVPDAESLHLGKTDFSLAVWVKAESPMRGTFGDIVSKFDPRERRGLNFHIAGSSPGYVGMCDTRHVHVGIDDGYLGPWEDHGRPCETNSFITDLVVFEGQLYAGIADAANPRDAARVFRWDGGKKWIGCGRLGDDPNHLTVQSLYVHQGKLYAGTGIWSCRRAWGLDAHKKGNAAAAKPRVFVYEGGTKWRDLGQVGETTRVMCMASFDGELYVGTDKNSSGSVAGRCVKYNGSEWVDCGAIDGANVENLLPVGGTLYATTHGSIFRYEGGKKWTCLGDHPFEITQIHSLDLHEGRIYIGTWPQGYVLRYEGGKKWTNTGRLGLPEATEGEKECNEVNDLTVHNGKLYAGAIPKAEFYRYESDGQWTLLKSLASRPDWGRANTNSWCRVTVMASYQGRLFAGTGSCRGLTADQDPGGTLGRVHSIQIGQVTSHERDLGDGWHHLAVVRRGPELSLYVDGRLSSSSLAPGGRVFDLTNTRPLRIGLGAQTYFTGAMSDLRLYARALEPDEVRTLCEKATPRVAVPKTRETSESSGFDLLLPAPREVEVGRGRVSLDPSVKISVPERWAGSVGRYLWLLDEILTEKGRKRVAIVSDPSSANIRIVRRAEKDVPANGYGLKIHAEGIELGASDLGGVFNGLATLAQLIESCGHDVLEVPAGTIRDWPELATRAVHIDLVCQQYQPAYVRRLMRTLARYKVNALLMEYGGMFPFREHLAVRRPDAFTEEDLRAIRRTAEECNQELIPLMQCAGHLEYVLTQDPAGIRLSEGHAGRDYCLTNTSVLPFAKSLIDETLSQHPDAKRLHVGGDEVNAGDCKKCAAAGDFRAMYLRHYERIAEYCLGKGVTPLMWTDVIAPFELRNKPKAQAAAIREAVDTLPRGIVGVDWWYRSNDFRVSPVLREAGVQAFTASAARSGIADLIDVPRMALHADNIRAGCLQAAESKMLGTIITSWSYRFAPHEVTLPGYACIAYGWNLREADVLALLTRFFRQRYGVSKAAGAALVGAMLSDTQTRVPTVVSSRARWNAADRTWTVPAEIQAGQLLGDLDRYGSKKTQRYLNDAQTRLARNDAAWSFALKSAKRHQDELRSWDLSRRHLQHRLRLSRTLARMAAGADVEQELDAVVAARNKLREEWRGLYRDAFTTPHMGVELDLRFDVEERIVDIVRQWSEKQARTSCSRRVDTAGIPCWAEVPALLGELQ